MRDIALDLATEMPFRRAARIMSKLVPGITAMSVWEVARQAGEVIQKEGDTVRQAVFEDGVIPKVNTARCIVLEADGVIINQQKAREKRPKSSF